jgi:hypothetical protein
MRIGVRSTEIAERNDQRLQLAAFQAAACATFRANSLKANSPDRTRMAKFCGRPFGDRAGRTRNPVVRGTKDRDRLTFSTDPAISVRTGFQCASGRAPKRVFYRSLFFGSLAK